MKNLGEFLQNKKYNREEKITNERQEILKKFIDRINEERKIDGFKPLPPAAFGVRLAKIKTKDLYVLYAECEESKSFSKFFWWKLKELS